MRNFFQKMYRQHKLMLIVPLLFCFKGALCQKHKPGLAGMPCPKWIMLKNSQAPGRLYKTTTTQQQVYTQEDIYFKIWLPAVYKPRYAIAIAPQYRSEQLELRGDGDNAIQMLSDWNLRYMGLDLRSLISLDTASWIMLNYNVNKSGNFHDNGFKSFPLNNTFSAAYIRKQSPSKETGIGFIINQNNNRLTILPILIYHYNFSGKTGIEINLPYKIAWRYNVSPRDIIYIKAEGQNRNYAIKRNNNFETFRRTDVDLGIAYNRQLNRFTGIELFAGYKQNLRTELPGDAITVKASGMVYAFEFYIRPFMKIK